MLVIAIEMTQFVLYYVAALAYAITDLKHEEKENKRGRRAGEEKQRPMPRDPFSRALPSSVIICNFTISCIIKTFHVGSVFELDVVLSS